LNNPALLALEDGSLFHGTSIGSSGQAVGEVVFNTAMTGYQEILTDPSYASQMVTLTYPHIGNVGTNPLDQESSQVWASGLIIRDLSRSTSNWRSSMSLNTFLQENHVVGIADIDTRRLTRLLRDQGAMRGCITTEISEPKLAIDTANAAPSLEGMDLAKVVSVKDPYTWVEGEWLPDNTFQYYPEQELPRHVVVYDFGVKHSILRYLVSRGCHLTIVPAMTAAEKVIEMQPDGVVLANGPGDPASCDYAIKACQELLKERVPVFGICLGFQILAIACGAKTFKMKFGHHGTNHPVQETESGRVYMTSQNHGFAVDEDSLPSIFSTRLY